jgi:hypothetical protein
MLHQAFAQYSTMAIDTAQLLAGDAIQALNHKDITGALEHLKLIVQGLGISGNSTSKLNSKFVSHTRTHIPVITSQQSGFVPKNVFQMLGKTVPIPSGPGSGLLSTRVFQTVTKAVPNPSNQISCIASTSTIQMLGKTVLNPSNYVSCIASNPIIQMPRNQNSGLLRVLKIRAHGCVFLLI